MNQLDSILLQVSKPASYSGGEWNSITKDWDKIPNRIALCYPDTYDLGTSNLAIPILYQLLNSQPDVLAERVYAPWVDMESKLRTSNIPLFSLETRHALNEFDIVGFSLGYELTYTNVLNILDLGKIPLRSSERTMLSPLIIAGGSCALNPEPMSDFIDLFVLGEGEEVILELLNVYKEYRSNKQELLLHASSLNGIYVPAFYNSSYDEDGRLHAFYPLVSAAKPKIQRRVLDKLPPPITNPVVPYIQTVHDHGNIEIQRGCTRGCRFCQAGMIYRPVRERPTREILDAIDGIERSCGYRELSLLSLSSGDYTNISSLLGSISKRYSNKNLTISLPSLRLDASSINLIDMLPTRHKLTLTFAPEVGSEKMRRVINKDISTETVLSTISTALDRGWTKFKLYFMVGLPEETLDDIEGIAELITKVRGLGHKFRLQVNASVLIPKPHTPFQWVAQEEMSSLYTKRDVLKRRARRINIGFSWAPLQSSQVEAALSRGDRRLGNVIYRAWLSGCRFDAWNDHFQYERWINAFEACGLDIADYANRHRDFEELLPWDHVDTGVTREFLKREYLKALKYEYTEDCSNGDCSSCGIKRWLNCDDLRT